jgi:transcriptional regulator with XRE-family HTH domain
MRANQQDEPTPPTYHKDQRQLREAHEMALTDDLAGRATGERIRHYRDRAGMSRPVLGGLVGKSAEWVKAIESGRLQAPRLPMLLRIAEVLGVTDLSELTGDQRLSVAHFGKARHESLDAVTRSLTDYVINPHQDTEPVTADSLSSRVRDAWETWHGSGRQRTAVSILLPGLLRDGRDAARRLDGTDRRRALVCLAETYHLVQLFLSFQPCPDLIMLCGDRAMTAAQDADDPRAIAGAAWYLNHIFRDAGEQPAARIEIAQSAAQLLKPQESAEDLARWGLLQLASALSHTRTGHAGDAWRHWDQASRAANALGRDYSHPYLIFGPGMVDAYAVTMNTDLMQAGHAIRQASRLDLAAMPSATRRSFHLIESARARSLRTRSHTPDPVAVVALLQRAWDESPDTARYNFFTRSYVSETAQSDDRMARGQAQELATALGIAA